jgi:hypothetical protein
MTYLTLRCVTSLESPRDAREVVETCVYWSEDPAVDEVTTEPAMDSSPWTLNN